jgi:hypothetical protein
MAITACTDFAKKKAALITSVVYHLHSVPYMGADSPVRCCTGSIWSKDLLGFEGYSIIVGRS